MLQTMWALLRIILLVFVGLISNVCYAQDSVINLSLDNQDKTHYAANQFKSGWDASSKTSFEQSLKQPGYDYWDDWVSKPSYRLEIEYVGFHKAVYNQIERVANRYYKQQLRTYWDQSYLDPIDLDRRMRSYNLYTSDFHNQWWNRRWYESLPPEKGGQVAYKQKIGCAAHVFQIGPVGLSNEGRFSWSSWRFDVEDNADTTLSDIEAIQQGNIREKYNLGLRTPEAEFRDKWYEMRFSAKVNVRADNLSIGNRSEVGCAFKFTLLNSREEPSIRFQASAKYQPLSGRAEIQCQLNLLEF